MISRTIVLAIAAFAVMVVAYPAADFEEHQELGEPLVSGQGLAVAESRDTRPRRSLQPDGPALPRPSEDGWVLSPSIGRNKEGNTNANFEVHHSGDDHDFEAVWGKVVDGPGRAKPVWHINGTWRF